MAYARRGEQFSKPFVGFQGIQNLLADTAELCEIGEGTSEIQRLLIARNLSLRY